MSVLIVVNTAPCGSDGPCDAYRLAVALVPRTELATVHDLVAATACSDIVLSF
jgi:sulfur relay (sulfurtransferase) complex TusBCD TusD component (DsrE family)